MITIKVMIKFLALIAFFLVGCKESSDKSSRRVIDGKYVIEEIARDESLESQEIDIRWIYNDGELPISRLFVHKGQIITLSPTPTQSDAIRNVGNYSAIGNGWTKTMELTFNGSTLIQGLPCNNDRPREKPEEISLDDFVELHRDKPLSGIYLTIRQGTYYSEFIEAFEDLSPCAHSIGLGYYAEIDP